MAKKFLPVVTTRIDDFGYTIDILKPDTMWIVTYQMHPIIIKRGSQYTNESKYRRTSFAQKGSAVNLAKRLNQQFNTQDFDIRQV
jgi:hypothetical protein